MDREEIIKEVFDKFLDVLNDYEDISAKRLIYETKWEFPEMSDIDFRELLARADERLSKRINAG